MLFRSPVTDSTIPSPDVITDFVRGEDKIDITKFNDQLVGGASYASYTSVFRWAGSLSSSSVPLGFVGYRVTSTGVDLYANPYGLNGDTTPDLRVSITGLSALSSSDILL